MASQTQQPQVSNAERVKAWTISQAADALRATTISSPSTLVRGTTVSIEIPLDEHAVQDEPARPRPETVHTVYKRREPVRRDSLKRREALLKGKEGSRRRQRWENDRLLHNPYAQPPLPSDFEVRPTYPVHSVPYFLAPLWDAGYAKSSEERRKRAEAAGTQASKEEAAAAKVTQELRARLKRSRGAKGLLQDLEEEVRGFVRQWEEKESQLESEGLIEPDSEDEEIVFVGRGGTMSDERREHRESKILQKDKLVFQSLIDDHGAAFGYVIATYIMLIFRWLTLPIRRYLVHSIAAYYDLKTWSVTTVSISSENINSPIHQGAGQQERSICGSEDRPDHQTAESIPERDAEAVICHGLTSICGESSTIHGGQANRINSKEYCVLDLGICLKTSDSMSTCQVHKLSASAI